MVSATTNASSPYSPRLSRNGAGPLAGTRAGAPADTRAGASAGTRADASAGTLSAPGALDREHLLDRLNRLRAILPAFAEELASSRRQAAALRVKNRELLAEVRRLQHQQATGKR